ncbi:thyrotropin-releasing hormone receptor-like [Physella acuta]|uniref:thyrotropin-releasing hormone receptor-like n=1 Tax=Physella acuta TaxID=109671 RepID=UPI0027DBB263|nr:thyrotropin-releasing hormone receptor-like [Physella acuta]
MNTSSKTVNHLDLTDDFDYNFVWTLDNANISTDNTLFCYSSIELETIRVATKVFDRYVVPVICAFGIVGGVISFLIFVATKFRNMPCSHYLALLSIVDTMFLTTHAVNTLMNYFPTLAWSTGCCFFVVYTSYVSSFLSAWFVVLIMLERYIMICHPFKHYYLCSKTTSITLVAVTVALALIAYSHCFLTLDISNKKSLCVTDPNYIEFLSIFTYADTIAVFVVPFFSILYLNLRIITAVRKLKKRFKVQNRSRVRVVNRKKRPNILSLAEVRSTKLLVWVSTIYIFFYLPSYVVRIFGLISTHTTGPRLCEPFFHGLQQLSQILHLLNYAIDIVVYSASSTMFRKTFMQVYSKTANYLQCIK